MALISTLDIAQQLGVARGHEVPKFNDVLAVVFLDCAIDGHLGQVGHANNLLDRPGRILDSDVETYLHDNMIRGQNRIGPQAPFSGSFLQFC